MMTYVPPTGYRFDGDKYLQQTTNGVSSTSGIHHRDTPPVGCISYIDPSSAAQPKLSTTNEAILEEELDDPRDNEMSVEAQAHTISMFLCSSNSDSGGEELVSETVITDVYKDPLELCMDGIEEMARKILRTGRLAITGEPGDMGKIQPAMFNLQASEKEMAQLVPQMMQNAFFHQTQEQPNLMESFDDTDDPVMLVRNTDEALATGKLRLGIPVDGAIYTLLHSHCAKGPRQAEEVINMAMKDAYTPAQHHNHLTMPPIIKFNANPRLRHPSNPNTGLNGSNLLVTNLASANIVSSSSLSEESSLSLGATSFSSLPRSDFSDTNLGSRKNSDEVPSSSRPISAMEKAQQSTDASSSSQTSSHRRIDSIEEGPELTMPKKIHHAPLAKSLSNRSRKTSTVIQPSTRRSRGDSVVSESSLSETYYMPGAHLWNTSIIDNNTIVAQYGSTPYELIWWDPGFKMDFRLSSSVGLISGTVTGIDPSKPEVTLKVFNSSAKQVGFAIRSHRQSTAFSSHVVYPNKGLEILEPYKSWEDNVEFHSSNPTDVEMFVIDLFFCTMDAKPSWNVHRKYAIMKAHKSQSQHKRMSKRRMSHLQLPGAKDLKSENLELVLSHGLQCVVKGKLHEAEIIFSQALYLPDFQRVALKAFVYICLSVIANKRLKLEQGGLKAVMVSEEASSKLVNVCETGPGSVKMPYTIQLVKQLRKELNLEKIVKEFKKVGYSKRGSSKIEEQSVEEFKAVSLEGQELTFKGMMVIIPPKALTLPTNISLSQADSEDLIPMLKATGWEKIVQVATAIHIECNPPLDQFSQPIKITTKLPKSMNIGPNSVMRLMHSNYLRHWEDITDDILTKISIEGDQVHIETNLSGWLAISMIQFDASMIAQMVLKSISIEPIILRLSVFGYDDSERKSIQMAVFVVPCKENEDPIHREIEKPENFVPISFPHVIQAYPNERLRLDIQGSFEPDKAHCEESLAYEMMVQQKHSMIYTKWVKYMDVSGQPLSGKLKISSCRSSEDLWENISEVTISIRNSSSASSASDH